MRERYVNTCPDHALTAQDIQQFFAEFGWLLPFVNDVDSTAYQLLADRGRFAAAASVLDIGAGTGYLAELLLRGYLPSHARCALLEVVESLAKALRSRFASWGDRVSVHLVGVRSPYPFVAESFERVVSSYVFDMMNRNELQELVRETHRLLTQNGLLCLLVTGRGFTALSRLVMGICSILHKVDPRLVGVGRPIDILSHFPREQWAVVSVDRVSRFGFASDVLILRKVA